ncbi:MAG: glycosyl transferase [Chloroflexota bacterium]
MDYYCTYFDSGYLLRGLTLYRSLLEHSQRDFVLWVLCFDDYSYEVISRLDQANLRAVRLQDFEHGDEPLLQAKQNRSRVEYFFTCTPSWPLYLLDHHNEIGIITYLDADLYFFSDLQPVFAEIKNYSALIIPHGFPPELKHLEIHGIFNVGLLMFRNDNSGREILTHWREQCLDWCGDYPDNNRFADQKYLDEWPAKYKTVVVSANIGANLAPWNWMNYREITRHDGKIWVEETALIFYHYQGLKLLLFGLYDPGMSAYKLMPYALRILLYSPYINELHATVRWAQSLGQQLKFERSKIGSRTYGYRRLVKGIIQRQITWNL